MAFNADRTGKIGQSTYWMFYIGYLVMTILLIGGAIYKLFHGEYFVGIMLFLFMGPLGIAFRIVVMRRCRDIGWPAWLAWAPLMLLFVAYVIIIMTMIGGNKPSGFTLILPTLLGMADFLLTIIVGCIPSKDEAYRAFDYDDPGAAYRAQYEQAQKIRLASPPAKQMSMPQAYGETSQSFEREDETARQDAAIARALESYRNSSSSGQPAISGMQQRSGGFGRKGV